MFGKKTLGPSYPSRPYINDNGESNIQGLYILGDISGTALIKLTLNQGYHTANLISEKLKNNPAEGDVYSVIVVGTGCAGIGALRQLKKLKIKSQEYFLVSIHRKENVTDPKRLKDLVKSLKLLKKEFGLPIIFPIHPRTKKAAKN